MHREIPLLKDYYQHWKEDYDLEVVLISLDTDPIKYAEFIHDFPWFPVVISRVGPGECQELLRFGYTHDVFAGQTRKYCINLSAGHVEALLKVKNNKKSS
jgi:hypothetical protein